MTYSAPNQHPPQALHLRRINSRPAAAALGASVTGSPFSRRFTSLRHSRILSASVCNPKTRYASVDRLVMTVVSSPEAGNIPAPVVASSQALSRFASDICSRNSSIARRMTSLSVSDRASRPSRYLGMAASAWRMRRLSRRLPPISDEMNSSICTRQSVATTSETVSGRRDIPSMCHVNAHEGNPWGCVGARA